MKKQIIQDIKSIILALIIVLGVGYVSASWTPAPPNPPSGNVDAPVNVGASAQYKSGFLQVNANDASGTSNAGWAFMVPGAPSYLHSLLVANNITTINGRVGVGTVTPANKLDVVGDVGVNGKTTTTNLEVGVDALVSGKITAGTLRVAGGSPIMGRTITATNAQGEAVWSGTAFGGMFMRNLDANGNYVDCRYANPLTDNCSCPPGFTRYRVWEFMNVNGQFYRDNGTRIGYVDMFQCMAYQTASSNPGIYGWDKQTY